MADGGQVDEIVSRHQGLVRASFPGLRGSPSPSTWVWAVCRNVFSRYLYRKRRNERVVRRVYECLYRKELTVSGAALLPASRARRT